MGIQAELLLAPVVYLVYHSFQMHVAGLRQTIERPEMERRHAEATAGLHLRTIRALALAIEAKDQTTAEHLHRVQTYAVELGKDFELASDEMEALRAAAILHDIGKIAVPEHIISKPAKLTPEEFGEMKIHPIVGADIIESIKFPFPVGRLVRAHHEKWDGSGYPDGLTGKEIPLGARILSAVDCLDALASDRQYRKAMALDKAINIIIAESGKSFDPRVVEVLSKRYRELESLARATIDDTHVGFATHYEVPRGLAPDAGFAEGSDSQSGRSPLRHRDASLELSGCSKGRSRAVREPLQEKCNWYAQGQIQLLSVTRPISRIAVHAVSLALLSVCPNLGNRAVADESRVMKTLRKREATPLNL